MLEKLFGTNKPVIGVIHLLPLPGSCQWAGDLDEVILRAEQEAVALSSGGVDGIIVENFFDAPFAKDRVDVSTACALTLAVKRIMSVTDLPIGVNVLRNDALTALAVAVTSGAKFIRVNILSGAMVTDQGLIESCARELHMYRRELMAKDSVKIFADVMVKHAMPLGIGYDIALAAKDTVKRSLADAIIVSGTSTGDAPSQEDMERVKNAVPGTPLLIGSGSSQENVKSLLGVADGIIVASSLKRQGVLENPVDVERVRSLLNVVNALR
ncbi:MAG: BtpA/SgcQ family protein [Candidatus Melainabacteria bacterium]|nr:BtpA/SgcQ family protein [Candidatus Melainabacteria bacterium]